jgi:GTP cyclohydrolase FolE2
LQHLHLSIDKVTANGGARAFYLDRIGIGLQRQSTCKAIEIFNFEVKIIKAAITACPCSKAYPVWESVWRSRLTTFD